MNSTAVLEFMAKHDLHIYYQRATPGNNLKRDLITLRTPDGKYAGMSSARGYVSVPVQIPPETVSDYLKSSYIEQDGQEKEGTLVFRLTTDGKTIGLRD